ncbi:MAG: hypothetical protein DSY43_04465 [Gammaproteobacteria bacterium]|nr:MAG: hypothetical protein DSY43_04465 [Gammaproteobacteria bacterium]
MVKLTVEDVNIKTIYFVSCRVNYYIQNKLDTKYLRDPDGGLHVLRKKAEAGLLPQSSPEELQSYPTEGYSVDLSKIPKITFGTVWKFMIDSMEWKRQLSTAKPLVKGYNFFMSKHVLSVYHLFKDSKHYIKSQVLPSMKKSVVYSCFLKMSSLGFVLSAKCGCPAGVDGRCNHVCATLFLLDSFCKKKGLKSCSDDDVSCTSKPCQWNVPRKRKGSVEPISTMKFRKHDYNKRNKVVDPVCEKPVQSEPLVGHDWSKERLQGLFHKLKEIEQKTKQSIGWCHILPQDIPEKCSSEVDNGLLSPIKMKDSPVSIQGIKERIERVKCKLFVGPEQAAEIEEVTKDQSLSKSWHSHRQYRITASKCYRAAVLKDTTSPTKAINDILYAKVLPTKQMKKGLEMESEIMARYIEHQHKCGHKDLSVEKSGLIVGKFEDGFLGASPDGLVCDPSVPDSKGLLEMKYIETQQDESLEDALVRKHVCVRRDDSTHSINRKHKYFYQVQQGMYLTETKWTDFVVLGSQSPGIFVERLCHDPLWWENIKIKLGAFYHNYILPEIAYPKIKYGQPRIHFPRSQ